MFKKLKKTFSLTEKGSKQLIVAIFTTTLHNLSVIAPAFLLFIVVSGLISHYNGKSPDMPSLFYVISISVILVGLIYFIFRMTYQKSFGMSYQESANVRIALAEKLRKLPLSFFGKRDLSDLTSTLVNDVAILEHALSSDIPSLFGGIISSSIVILVMISFNVKLSIAMFSCILIVMIVMYLAYKLAYSANVKNRNAKLSLSDILQEYFDNMKLMHASQKIENYKLGIFTKIKYIVKRAIIFEVVMGMFISFAYNALRVGMGLTIIVGSALLANNEIDIYTMLLFLIVAARIYDPLTDVTFRTGEFFFCLLSARRISQIDEYPHQLGDKIANLDNFNIECKNVSFAYNDGKNVIDDVSFVAKQGQVTALVGPSGCGKSTLTKLICRFWDINKGQITVGGEDISQFDTESLFQYFSIVFQDVILFNDTVYNNIKIGKKDATKEEIYAAAKMAQCEEFINNLPDGYETNIGENGKTLSGGERQRISIARAFLKNAPIIFLDEATASLDPENETRVQEALSSLLIGKTVVIIAHRLRTVENCDNIIVLNDGKLIEQGSHSELMNNKNLYYKLFTLQKESLNWTV